MDHSNAPLLEDAMQSSSGGGVLIDLTRCGYLDSGGLGVILTAVQESSRFGWVGVIGPNANVLRLFEVVGLTTNPAFRVFETEGDASDHLVPESA